MGGRYRYLLEHSIAGEDLEPLRSGLEDEQGFRLHELVGRAPLEQMLEEGELDIDTSTSDRFFAFGPSIEILSVYLPEYVSGVEVAETLDHGLNRRRIECYRYIGRRGELVTVPLEYAMSLDREIVPGHEDLSRLREMWHELPTWARVAYKQTFVVELGDLDAGPT
ncbi:MAG TPA: hypothetical protein VFA20_05815 [Myxococcaceae bacterium]|nr:hypothetical protein [Myxococcaceae bacterium]